MQDDSNLEQWPALGLPAQHQDHISNLNQVQTALQTLLMVISYIWRKSTHAKELLSLKPQWRIMPAEWGVFVCPATSDGQLVSQLNTPTLSSYGA